MALLSAFVEYRHEMHDDILYLYRCAPRHGINERLYEMILLRARIEDTTFFFSFFALLFFTIVYAIIIACPCSRDRCMQSIGLPLFENATI